MRKLGIELVIPAIRTYTVLTCSSISTILTFSVTIGTCIAIVLILELSTIGIVSGILKGNCVQRLLQCLRTEAKVNYDIYNDPRLLIEIVYLFLYLQGIKKQ